MKQYKKLSVEMLSNSEDWKPRFVISDFVATISETSSLKKFEDRVEDKEGYFGHSLFVDTDTQSFVAWSGQDSYLHVPEVGMKIKSRVPVEYEGIVRGHYFSYGYVGIKVEPYPWFHKALSNNNVQYGNLPTESDTWTDEDLVWNYGNDLLEANYDFIYKDAALELK